MGINDGLRNVSQHLAAGYRLAYATLPDLKKRKIELTVARPGAEVLLPKRTDIATELEPEF